MSHTNQTQYYELPQYVGTDIINPLVDTNGAYQKIDTTMHDIAEVAGQSTTDIANLQTKVGTGVFATTAQDATGAVNELYDELNDDGTGVKGRLISVENDVDTLQSQMVTAQGNMMTLQTKVGSATLDTTAQDLSGAVNELKAGITELPKKFLFVGDSYGDSTGRGYNCWPEFFAQALGLNSNQFNNLCKDSAGIYGSDNPQYMFITQLQNYAGDKTSITDIVIGEASNDTVSDDPTNAVYTHVKSNLSDIVAYVKSNYPNAKLYIGYIANSYDTSSIIGNRTYRARQTFKQLLKEWCAEFNIKYLNGAEYALCGGGQFFTSDLLHPSVVGEKYLGYAMARAYTSADANVSYYYKNNYTLVSPFTIQYGCGSDVSVEDNIININLNNWGVTVPENTVISTWQIIASSNDIFFNIPLQFDSHVRLYGFNGKGDQYLPCTFRLDGDKLQMHIQEIENGSFVQSWTAGATAFFTIDGIVVTTNSDVTA